MTALSGGRLRREGHSGAPHGGCACAVSTGTHVYPWRCPASSCLRAARSCALDSNQIKPSDDIMPET